jgi:hypothetical protein
LSAVNDTDSPARPRLSLRQVLWGAFALPWQHRGAVARATGLPLLAVIAVTLAWEAADLNDSGAARWTLYFLYWLAVCWLATTVHRLVLLQGDDARNRMDASGLRRLGMFAGTALGMWLLFAVLIIFMMSVMLIPFSRYVPAGESPPPTRMPGFWPWINTLAMVLAAWVVGRVSLMLPAIAVDRRMDPIAAWVASRGNGWKLAIVIAVLPWALGKIGTLLYRDGASTVEFALLLVLTTLFIIVEIVALSLSYWELTAPAPPPTPPPG